MNLNMIQPKNQTENLLLSITKKCETLIKQTHTKPEGTLEFKLTKPRETFYFNLPIQIKGDWMIGLLGLEDYSSFFNINTTKINSNFIQTLLTNFHSKNSKMSWRISSIFQI